MIAVKLREAMQAYKRRTGKKMTYETLAHRADVNRGTLAAIGSRPSYKPGLDTIEKICIALDVPLSDLLELVPDKPRKSKKKKTSRKKNTKKR